MSEHQFEQRIARLQSSLVQHECDAFMSVEPADNAYLTGFFGSTSALLVTAQSARLLCDFRYSEQATAQLRHAEVVESAGNLDVRLAEYAEGLRLKRIAFEPETLSVARHETIQKNCTGKLVAVPGICRNLRQIGRASCRERV